MNTGRTKASNRIFGCIVLLATLACTACSKKSEDAASAPGQPATPAAPAEPTPSATAPTPARAQSAEAPSGTLTTNPSPVAVCPKTGLGAADLSWTTTGTKNVEVHVDAPDGKLFTRAGSTGTEKTGNWVRKGTVFYLQNVDNNAPLVPANTLAKLEVETTPGTCK